MGFELSTETLKMVNKETGEVYDWGEVTPMSLEREVCTPNEDLEKPNCHNRIIKALEKEIKLAEYVDSSYCDGVNISLIKDTLDLIGYLKAEIERLKPFEKKVLEPVIANIGETLKLEKFWTKVRAYAVLMGCYHIVEYGDNAVKEMVGD